MKRLAHRLLLALAVLASASAAAAQDDDFLAARDAFRAGNSQRLDGYAARLRGYPLEPYVQYWQLRLRLDEASPADVRAFIARNADAPVSRSLLADWLRLLGRTGQWQQFDIDYALYSGEDLDITCYGIQSKVRAQPEAIGEARSLWFVVKDLPDNCTTLFSALMQEQKLTQDDIWVRVRLALEAGQVTMAQRAAVYLTPGTAPDARALNMIFTNPAGYLDRLQQPDPRQRQADPRQPQQADPRQPQIDTRTRGARETTMFAVARLGRSSPQQAAAYWLRIEPLFSGAERGYVWGQLAQSAAMRHDAEAPAWFAKARDLSDTQLGWKARAALRARNWRDVQAAIDAMSPRERELSTWRYWKARALKAQGREDEAVAMLKPVAREYSFYGQLALEELGEKIGAPATGFKPSPDEIKAMTANATVRRALTFYRLDLRVDATREWIWLVRNLDDRQLITAAEVARQYQLYDRAINTADKTEAIHDFSLRYPAPFREVLRARAGQMQLDEAWVYGLIRQESRFITDARSRVGAGGLMQLMPATAKWVANKLGLRRMGDVTEVDTNVTLGTYYLRHVLDSLDGYPALASAAYNAGPGRARAWRPDLAPIEGAVYAESIPFSETRDYVKKVMSNASYYGHGFTGQLQSLRERLGIIGPRQRAREPALGDTP